MKLKCRNCKAELIKDNQIKHGFCCLSCKDMYKEKKGSRYWIFDALYFVFEMIVAFIP